MAAHIDAGSFLFHLQFHAGRAVRKIRQGDPGAEERLAFLAEHAGIRQVEEAHLAGDVFLSGGLVGLHGLLIDRQHLGAVGRAAAGGSRQAVEGAGPDEAFNDPLAAFCRVHPAAEIKDVAEGAAGFPLPANRVHGVLADAFYGAQAEKNRRGSLRSRFSIHCEFPAAAVHVRGKNSDALSAAVLDVAGDFAGVAVDTVQHGGHELDRVMALQPGSLHSDDAVGRGMGFIEGVGGEGNHFVVDFIGDVLRHAVAHTAGDRHPAVLIGQAVDKDFPLLVHDFMFFLGHGPAHQVAAAVAVARQVADDLHDLFLIDHAAVGYVQDRAEFFRFVFHAGRVHFSGDIAWDGVHGTRAIEGDGGNDVLEAGGLHIHEEAGHPRAFHLEDALGVAAGDHFVNGGVVQGGVFRGHILPDFPHHIQGIADHREGAEAQEVHFQQAQTLDGAHGILGGDDIVVALEGDVFHDGFAGDKDARRVGGGVARHAFQGHGGVNQLLHAGLFVHHLAQGGRKVQGFFQGHAQIHGHGFGHGVGFLVAHTQNPAHVAHDAAGCHGAEGDDLTHVVGAVFPGHVVDDFRAALVAEVHVDIRHGNALRVQEALEEELVAQGIQHGDAQGVGHDGTGAAAAAGAHHDAVGFGPVDEVPDDEEVVHIAHFFDDAELVFQTRIGLVLRTRGGRLADTRRFGAGLRSSSGRRHGIGVELPHAFIAQAAKHLIGSFAFGNGVMRQTGDAEFKRHIAAVRDLTGAVHGVRHVFEERAHFLLAFDVELAGFHAHALLVRKGFAGLDAHQHFLGRGVFFLEIVTVIRSHQGNVHFPGNSDQTGQNGFFLPDVVVHDFNIEVVRAEKVLHLPDIGVGAFVLAVQKHFRQVAAEAGAQADQAFMIFADQVVIDTGLIVITGQKAFADQPHQVLIAGVVFTQEDQMAHFPARRGTVCPVPADVGLTADDGLEACLRHGRVEINDAVEYAVVRDGARIHAERLQAFHQGGDPAGPVQQAVLRMKMQMGKAHRRSPLRACELVLFQRNTADDFLREVCGILVCVPEADHLGRFAVEEDIGNAFHAFLRRILGIRHPVGNHVHTADPVYGGVHAFGDEDVRHGLQGGTFAVRLAEKLDVQAQAFGDIGEPRVVASLPRAVVFHSVR